MMLDFFQIIFKEEQREKCYPFAKVYFNETLTDYFENDVICRLVPYCVSNYVSVCSWRLRQKRGESSTPQVLGHRLDLSEERILSQEFDVAILTPRRPTHPTLLFAHEWHRDSFYKAFEVFKEFLSEKKINVPDWRNGSDIRAIYENHFIARNGIYKSYVHNILAPAIRFMDGRDVFRMESGYKDKKRDLQEVKAYQAKSGRQDWPIAPFILERLFSLWIHEQKLNVINL